jgi:hypothetical protein
MTIPEQRGLHRELEAVHNESRVFEIATVLLGLVGLVFLICLTVLSNRTLDKIGDINSIDQDCTTTNGDCYQRNQQTAQFEQAHQARIAIVSQWCVRNTPVDSTAAGLEQCVVDQLRKFTVPPSPMP